MLSNSFLINKPTYSLMQKGSGKIWAFKFLQYNHHHFCDGSLNNIVFKLKKFDYSFYMLGLFFLIIKAQSFIHFWKKMQLIEQIQSIE